MRKQGRLRYWVLFAVLVFCGSAHAQYNPIPNFTGTLAGQQFRNALNNKLNGQDTIAPQLVHLNFFQLPAQVVNGQMYYINDGTSGIPCRGGGAGAIAMGVDGKWVCGNAGTQRRSVLDFGARGDCVSFDDAAIQAAIDAVPNNGNDGNLPVYLPATEGIGDGVTSKCYLLGKPLVLPHGGINLYGDGREQTFVQTGYYGPVLLAGTDTLSLGTALLNGGGKSLNLSGAAFLELSLLLRNHLNGHNAFSIEFELNVPLSPRNSMILQIAYDWPYQSYSRGGLTDVGAFAISYQSSNPHLTMQTTLTTSGLVSIDTASNSMTAGNHAVGFYYDGAHLWSCIDGTASGPQAATGTWVQSKWESITLPDMYGNSAITWPDGAGGAGVSNDSFSGALDNLRISNMARASSGTCPSVTNQKFVYDGNTDLLMTFSSCADAALYCLENATGQYAIYAQSRFSSSAGHAVWLPVIGHNGGSAAHLYVHDMALGWNDQSQGAYVLNAPWSQFERLAGVGEHNGLNLYYSDYESTVRETRFLGANHNGYQAYEFGYVTNTANVENATAEQAFVCFNLESAQTGFESKSGHCLVNGETAIGWLIDYSSGTLIDPFLDQEGPVSMLTPIYFRGATGEGALTLINGNLDTYGGVPFIVHDAGGNGPVEAIGTLFNNFAEDQPAPAIIQFPGFQTYGNISGTIWQGQPAAALAPHIANAPGTCTGIGSDTNCAKFVYPGVTQLGVNAPCSIAGSIWVCTSADSAGTRAVLGNPVFHGAQGTFSAGASFADSYTLLAGQIYLLKGANSLALTAVGGYELSISSTTPPVNVYVAGDAAGGYTIPAIAPASGVYNFTLAFGASSCCGNYHGLITPTANLPALPDVLQNVTFADANLPLSNEVGNAHVEWLGRSPDSNPSGQQERYIP